MFEKTENKQKEAEDGPIKKHTFAIFNESFALPFISCK